ncbi:hypothetical protein [Streptosporangium canum]|uniref:hypothetical protein n=1 Tax=Streptosporangium canum TaxID=324952 RepID=UPI00379B584D
MIPAPDTPVSGQWRAVTGRPAAVAALQRLRAELHTHRIHPEISYDEGLPRLVLNRALTVWTDHAGTVYCWGAGFQEEPADHAPAEELQQVARQLAERFGEHYVEPEPATTTP